MVDSGADMIELGIPFSDPMADGPTIQRASERALAHHVGLSHVFKMVKAFLFFSLSFLNVFVILDI